MANNRVLLKDIIRRCMPLLTKDSSSGVVSGEVVIAFEDQSRVKLLSIRLDYPDKDDVFIRYLTNVSDKWGINQYPWRISHTYRVISIQMSKNRLGVEKPRAILIHVADN